MSDLHGFQLGVEPPLLFVEQAVEQHDGRLELLGKEPSRPQIVGLTADPERPARLGHPVAAGMVSAHAPVLDR
jgi:hypothetical protein